MCGRFAQIREEEELMKSLSVHHCEVSVETSYNIAPGADISIIHQQDGRRVLDSRRWGLIPFWAKEGGRGICLLYTSPSPRDREKSRMPSSA